MSAVGDRTAGAPAHVVGPYLAAELGDVGWRDCIVELISGGKSNLTYQVTGGPGTVVLRRPPLSSVLPTAHDMVREYRVVSGLRRTEIPVPAALHLCRDTAVLGAPFWVSAFVEGPIVREDFPPGYADTPATRRAIAEALVDVLAALHTVDPSRIGLADFGRPEGYLTRQVSRWGRQWDATRDAAATAGAVDADAASRLTDLAGRLAADVPAGRTGPIVHGDYRLDNTVLDPAGPGRIAAVLDWEMSTLGDPLADLGMLLVYWRQSDDGPLRTAARSVPSATALPGFLTRAEVVERYAAATGSDIARLSWYVGFGCFKLAVVVAGIVARHRAGAMVGEGFDAMGGSLAPLVALGHAALDGDPTV
jgi:aminoglycoside phosphotransferase (APT) family kinase protein